MQVSGRLVTADAVAKARAEGATDVPIHDTVLIAAVACLLNRYVDGLGTSTYEDSAECTAGARFLVEHGYRTQRQPPRRAGLRAAIQTCQPSAHDGFRCTERSSPVTSGAAR